MISARDTTSVVCACAEPLCLQRLRARQIINRLKYTGGLTFVWPLVLDAQCKGISMICQSCCWEARAESPDPCCRKPRGWSECKNAGRGGGMDLWHRGIERHLLWGCVTTLLGLCGSKGWSGGGRGGLHRGWRKGGGGGCLGVSSLLPQSDGPDALLLLHNIVPCTFFPIHSETAVSDSLRDETTREGHATNKRSETERRHVCFFLWCALCFP